MPAPYYPTLKPEPEDVPVTSAYPHTHGHRFLKGLSTPDVVTRQDGAILLLAPLLAPLSRDIPRARVAIVPCGGLIEPLPGREKKL
ncbi:MAG TPA: hypothetical protein VK997_00590 [Deferrisomatales bacterium]|nr:hypothetical protein [Deferrisomatales bacterium]